MLLLFLVCDKRVCRVLDVGVLLFIMDNIMLFLVVVVDVNVAAAVTVGRIINTDAVVVVKIVLKVVDDTNNTIYDNNDTNLNNNTKRLLQML